MRGVKAKLLRNNAYGNMSTKRTKYEYVGKNNNQIVCTGNRKVYKLLKAQYKKNRMNHL